MRRKTDAIFVLLLAINDVAMIALASEMAPTVPSVQIKLGELLLKMGRRIEAQEYLHRAVELEPRCEIVLVERLPRIPEKHIPHRSADEVEVTLAE